MVSNRGLSGNIDVVCVFSLGIIQAGEDGVQQRVLRRCALGGTDCLCLCVQFEDLSFDLNLFGESLTALETSQHLHLRRELATVSINARLDIFNTVGAATSQKR